MKKFLLGAVAVFSLLIFTQSALATLPSCPNTSYVAQTISATTTLQQRSGLFYSITGGSSNETINLFTQKITDPAIALKFLRNAVGYITYNGMVDYDTSTSHMRQCQYLGTILPPGVPVSPSAVTISYSEPITPTLIDIKVNVSGFPAGLTIDQVSLGSLVQTNVPGGITDLGNITPGTYALNAGQVTDSSTQITYCAAQSGTNVTINSAPTQQTVDLNYSACSTPKYTVTYDVSGLPAGSLIGSNTIKMHDQSSGTDYKKPLQKGAVVFSSMPGSTYEITVPSSYTDDSGNIYALQNPGQFTNPIFINIDKTFTVTYQLQPPASKYKVVFNVSGLPVGSLIGSPHITMHDTVAGTDTNQLLQEGSVVFGNMLGSKYQITVPGIYTDSGGDQYVLQNGGQFANPITISIDKSFTVTYQKQTPSTYNPKFVTYWQAWDQASAPYFNIKNTSTIYNVINVAFANVNSDGSIDFSAAAPYITPSDVATAKAAVAGRKILLSIGGANSAYMPTKAALQQLQTLIPEYGFDGVDFDIEHGFTVENASKLSELIIALRDWRPDLLITLAPEVANFSSYWSVWTGIHQNYSQLINLLNAADKNKYRVNWVQIQLYNNDWSPVPGIDTYTAGYAEIFAFDLLNGWTIDGHTLLGLQPDQIILGFPAASGAAGKDYPLSEIKAAFNCVLNGVGCNPLLPLPQGKSLPYVGGIMNWSANYDVIHNYAFATTLQACVYNKICS